MTITQIQRLAEHHKRSFFTFPGYSYDDDELLRPDQVFHNTRAEEDNRLLCDCAQYRKAYTTHYCAPFPANIYLYRPTFTLFHAQENLDTPLSPTAVLHQL